MAPGIGVDTQASRRDQIVANISSVRRRVARACAESGRDLSEITLVAVTKSRPASDVRLLASLGLTDVGENRDQEAAPKAHACADLDLTWHFVGQLQTNKCRSVVSYADVVHSVDRPRLVDVLGREARRAGRRVVCFVQVRLDSAGDHGGVRSDDVRPLADAVAATDGLALAGVMAMAPQDADPDEAFSRLAEVATKVRADHREATMVSAGMSADMEQAIAHGATHLRIGTALLGARAAGVRYGPTSGPAVP
ncbi:MAG: YggS family pyridoxal phosphate-dependent enzyme [Streptosporangiaceae bacterium]